MSIPCTRCEATGFLNIHQVPDHVVEKGMPEIVRWMLDPKNQPHDVQVCDCCGDGENWYGNAGQHYSTSDPPGPDGPYAENGGLCECH